MSHFAAIVDAEDQKHIKIVGRNIFRIRTAQGLSQQEVANRCNRVDRAKLSKMENGLIDYVHTSLSQIARALGVKVEELTTDRFESEDDSAG